MDWVYFRLWVEPTYDTHISKCNINFMQLYSKAEWNLYNIFASSHNLKRFQIQIPADRVQQICNVLLKFKSRTHWPIN